MVRDEGARRTGGRGGGGEEQMEEAEEAIRGRDTGGDLDTEL